MRKTESYTMNEQTPDSPNSVEGARRRRSDSAPKNGNTADQKAADKVRTAVSRPQTSGPGGERALAARGARSSSGKPGTGNGYASVAPSVSPLPRAAKEIASHTPRSLKGNSRILHQMEQLARLDGRDRAALTVHVDSLIRRMPEINASDIDLGGTASNGHVWYRIDGEKMPDGTAGRYEPDEASVLILNLLDAQGRKKLIEWRACDFSYSVAREGHDRPLRFRASAYLDMEYLALNMRAITEKLRSVDDLSFHPSVQRGLMFRYVRDGLTLITGVTGSGKSTTMDAIIDANNKDINGHIVIIGSPIEYMHDSKKCIVRHREVGRDVVSFKDGIVQALRQDPDIVVIGEMRDPATISAALEITDSGHKVFSTLHTSSAVESIDRIIAEYPAEEQNRVRNRLADVLRCIVSQKLCPRVGGGRILAKEVLWMTSSARAAIKNNHTNEVYQMVWEGWAQGQITLEQDLFKLYCQGLITHETALNYSNNKRRFGQLIK